MKLYSNFTAEDLNLIQIDADPSFFYGEIAQNDMIAILQDSRSRQNVDESIADWCTKNNNSYFRTYALDPRRALGLELLGNLASKKILDYGCGIGSVGVPAARAGAHVYFVDSCLMRLEMALLRARQNGVAFYQGYACKTWDSLPRELKEFDVILVNGVLEWIPSTVGATFSNTLETQLSFLQSLGNRLTEKGTIYLAIENRFALQYLLGYPEDHTEIPYISLFDREKANKIHLGQKGSEFINWTWGLDEFHQYLPQAGLQIKEEYGIFPDYRFPQFIAALDDESGLREGMKLEEYLQGDERELMTEYFSQLHQLKNIVYCYAFLLEKI